MQVNSFNSNLLLRSGDDSHELPEKSSTSPKANQAAAVDKVAATDTVELSTRAKKIQQLNAEFFPGGFRSVKITPQFIERLQEYGFISSQEAEKLAPVVAKNQSSAGKSAELAQAIDGFSAELKQTMPESRLLSILQQARSALNNLDQPKSAAAMAEFKTVVTELTGYLGSEEARSLSAKDKVTLGELALAMSVADRLQLAGSSAQKRYDYMSIRKPAF